MVKFGRFQVSEGKFPSENNSLRQILCTKNEWLGRGTFKKKRLVFLIFGTTLPFFVPAFNLLKATVPPTPNPQPQPAKRYLTTCMGGAGGKEKFQLKATSTKPPRIKPRSVERSTATKAAGHDMTPWNPDWFRFRDHYFMAHEIIPTYRTE